jgi:Ca-activated chloride channel family protein
MQKISFLLAFVFTGLSLTAQNTKSVHKLLRTGDAQYKEFNLTGAEESYRKALSANNTNPKAGYNLSQTLHSKAQATENKEERAKLLASASEKYAQAANNIKDKNKKSNALQNQGAATLEKVNQNEDPQQAEANVKELEKGAKALKEALKQNPQNKAAAHNLAKIQSELKKQKQQQEKNKQQNKDKKEDKKEDQDKKDQENKKDDPNKPQPNNQPQQESKPEQKNQQMANAEQFLKDIKETEKNTQKRLLRSQKKYSNLPLGAAKQW